MFSLTKLLTQRSLDGNNQPLEIWCNNRVNSNIRQNRYVARTIDIGEKSACKQMGAFIAVLNTDNNLSLINRITNQIIWSLNLPAFHGTGISDPLFLNNEGIVGILFTCIGEHKKILLLIKDGKIIFEVKEETAVTLNSIYVEGTVLIYQINPAGSESKTIKILDLSGQKEAFIYSPGFNNFSIEYHLNYCVVSRMPPLGWIERGIHCIIDFNSRDIIHLYDKINLDDKIKCSALTIVNQSLITGRDKKLCVMDLRSQLTNEEFILATEGHISNIVYHHGVKLLVVTNKTPSGFSRVELHILDRDNIINQLYPVPDVKEDDIDLSLLSYNNSSVEIFCNNELIYFVINHTSYSCVNPERRIRPVSMFHHIWITPTPQFPIISIANGYATELLIYDIKSKAIVSRELFENETNRYVIRAFENVVSIGINGSSELSIRDYSQIDTNSHADEYDPQPTLIFGH